MTSTDGYGDGYESQPSNRSFPYIPTVDADVQLGNNKVELNVNSTVVQVETSGIFNILNNEGLFVTGSSGITNNGLITINPSGQGNITSLTFANGTLGGTGTLVMNSAGEAAQLNGTLTRSQRPPLRAKARSTRR